MSPLSAKIKLILWRHSPLLALVYLILVLAIFAIPAGYYFFASRTVDDGLAVVLRALAYKRSFSQVELARKELQAGRLSDAELILLQFTAESRETQSAQLTTHALTEAHFMLAEIYKSQGKLNKAVNALVPMLEVTPLNYMLWYRTGLLYKERGDIDTAARMLLEAFKQALNHPQVTEAYIEVLDEGARYADIAWVYDQFRRALKRAAPMLLVKMGTPRSQFQRTIMELADIPIEHGVYTRVCKVFNLERGDHRKAAIPSDMLDWHSERKQIYMQCRFENIYEDVKLEGLRISGKDGNDVILRFGEEQVNYLHRLDSGGENYAEICLNLDLEEIETLEIIYSCEVYELSESVMRIIAKANRNLSRAGGLDAS